MGVALLLGINSNSKNIRIKGRVYRMVEMRGPLPAQPEQKHLFLLLRYEGVFAITISVQRT